MRSSQGVTYPDFFIVGAPKCGTTALFTYLQKHPQVFMCGIKEPQFLAADILGDARQVRTWKDYLACFSAAEPSATVGEGSVAYLGSPAAAAAIRELNSEAKVIVMLRNPVDMMYSLHSQRIYDNTECVTSFEDALQADERRSCPRPPGLAYRDVARYEPQVRRYLDLFGRDNVRVILFDDFKSQTDAVYRDTLRFLGLDDRSLPDFAVVNSNHRARSMRVLELLKHPPQGLRTWVHRVTSQRVRRFVGQCALRLTVVHEPRVPMDPGLRRRLQREAAPDVEQLSKLLDRDLSGWCLGSESHS
jgi:hypothetical protein